MFEKITAAVPVNEHFDASVVNGEGVWLTTAHLNNIEVALINADNTDALTALHSTNDALVLENQTLRNNAVTKDNLLTVQQTKIEDLQTQITALGSQESGTGTKLPISKDETVEKTPVPSYLDDNNPANEWLDKRMRK